MPEDSVTENGFVFCAISASFLEGNPIASFLGPGDADQSGFVRFYKNKMFAACCSFVFLTFPRTLSATRRKLEELLKNKGLDVYHDGHCFLRR